MARKKVETIIGLGSDSKNKLTVQKSLPLFSLWRSDFSLAEFKILDVYLSRINSHTSEKRRVVFEKGELENILDVKKINISDLKKRVKHLMQPIIYQPDEYTFKGIALFEKADCRQDKITGLWNVSLECTQKAMKYFFNVENLGYLRYKLRCITNLTSRYSYILFTYIESNRFRKSWEITIQDLKKILACENEQTYSQFKRFNDLILKRCHKELTEKTECKFDYEPIKKGRAVVAIRFTIQTLSQSALDLNDNQHNQIDDIWKDDIVLQEYFTNDYDDNISFLQEACPEFDRTEMEEIFSILVTIPDNILPYMDSLGDNIEFRRYHYLKELYARMNRIASRTTIKNRFLYFIKMLKTDSER